MVVRCGAAIKFEGDQIFLWAVPPRPAPRGRCRPPVRPLVFVAGLDGEAPAKSPDLSAEMRSSSSGCPLAGAASAARRSSAVSAADASATLRDASSSSFRRRISVSRRARRAMTRNCSTIPKKPHGSSSFGSSASKCTTHFWNTATIWL